MAELIDTLQKITGSYLKEMGLTDMVIGTVSKLEPLEIILEGTMLPIPAEVILKTSSVIEKNIILNGHTHIQNTLSHSHSYTDSDDGSATTKETGAALTGSYVSTLEIENMICVENGVNLPVNGNVVTINRGLLMGDKVLLLRVLDGQKFIILSRIF